MKKCLMLFCLLLLNATLMHGQSPCVITGAATVCERGSTTLASCAGGTWATSAASFASVGASGVVYGIAPGTATISYTVSGTTYTRIITVQPLPITVIGGRNFMCASGTLTLSGSPTGGAWSSGSTSVANVSSSGVVTPVTTSTTGTTIITYSASNSCGTTSDTQAVTLEVPLGSPYAVYGSYSVCNSSGTSFNLMTSGAGSFFAPAGGTFSPVGTLAPIGTLNSLGLVTLGTSVGAATVSYTLANSCGSHTATMTLRAGSTVVGASGPGTLCAGASGTCIGSPGGGTWSSSASSIVSVDASTGVATAASGVTGTAILTYTLPAYGACSTSYRTTAVTVTSPAAITGPTTVCGGQTVTLSESVRGGTWSCSPSTVASIDASGVVTAASVGSASTATVTYTCGTATVTYTVTVNPTPPVPSISGMPSSICYGTPAILTGSPAGGTWTVTPAARATLSSLSGSPVALYSAVTSALAGGSYGLFINVTYTVTSAGCSSTFTASCTGDPIVSAGTISGPSSLCVGGTATLTTSGDISGLWSSSNTAVATVNATTGVVTYVGPGTAIITYSITSACNTSTATYTITCYGVPSAGTLSCPTTSVCPGGLATVTSTGPTTFGSWSSTDPSVVSVTGSGALTGLATGVTPGTADIIYTISNPCGSATASYTFTVNPPPVISGATNVCIGSSTPTSGAGRIASVPSTGVTWGMGTPASIATIGAGTGVVTGVGAGTAIITCTNSITGCVSTRSIVVRPLPVVTTDPYPVAACGSPLALTGSAAGAGAFTYTWYGSTIAVGGSAGATVSLTPSAITFSAAGLAIYTCTATDQYGCTGYASDTVVRPACDEFFCSDFGSGIGHIYALAGSRGAAGSTTMLMPK